jgi:nitrate reductase gamma subunit
VIWAIIGSIIGVLIVVAIVGFIIIRMKNRRLQANLAKYDTL